ncbi:MAG: hypothetical protein IM631_05415 [Cytophagales bacterium]|nr:hypothetical protein [Cytophagales bacterium]MCA6370821.1 hypothetical protein [Cytophagales bacterium]MCA6385826.1 hypothetical protein [Cytophagales bacterium]
MRQFILTGLVTVIMTMAYGQDLKNEDMELIKTEIQRMLKSDQKYRSLLSYGTLRQETADSIKSLSNDEQMKFMMSNKKKLAKNISDSLWTMQNNLDLENIIALEKIVTKYGWPSDNRLGVKISAEVLLFHTPTKKIESMETLLLKEVKEKRMDPNQFGMFVDNMRLKHGKSQLYGTNIEFSRELMKEMPPTVDDIETTNKARREIGLEILKEGEYRTKK